MKMKLKNEIIQKIMNEIGKDFADMLTNGLEETPELFPYTTACLNFIVELQEKEIEANIDSFNPEIINEIYKELTNYFQF